MDTDEASIYFKDLMSPAILAFISQINADFERLNENYKLIISGGEAFNYFIDSTEKTKVLKTHDFDIRLHREEHPSTNPLFTSERDTYENLMSEMCSFLINRMRDALNNYIKDYVANGFDQQLQKKNFQVDFSDAPNRNVFYTSESNFLKALRYNFTIIKNGVKYEISDTLVDLTPHIPTFITHYGQPNIKDFDKVRKTPGSYNVKSRAGYFNNYIQHVKSETPYIYYIGLGFLIWDTVRMLNWTIDAIDKNVKNTKLERYMAKYLTLLTALNEPEKYIRCNSSFVKGIMTKCSMYCEEKPKFCLKDGKNYGSKENIIDIGIQMNVFPNTSEWKKFLMKADFDDLCRVIQQLE